MRRAILVLAVVAAACELSDGGAYARRITSASELIGGPGAIGEVGDWLIGNQRVRFIIQDQGWSRGFGMFGGGIIDADLVRAGSSGALVGGDGRDNFGELFPAVFLTAFDVDDQWVIDPATGERAQVPGIEIIADGASGGAAVLRARASGGDFLTMVEELLGAAVPQIGLRFETDFVLRPGARHVEIVGRLINVSGRPIELPDPGINALLEQVGVDGLQTPLGDVALFGAGNRVFAPGAVQEWDDGQPVPGAPPHPVGFDLRFSVEASYPIPRALPALPGLVTDFLATAGDHVSYGVAAADSERNYVWLNRDQYAKDPHAPVSRHAMLVPFLMSAFAGAYYEVPPAVLAPAGQPGDTYEYRRYLIVGTGDVASIRDELYRIRGEATATLSGRIINRASGQPEAGAWLHVLDAGGFPYSQVRTNADGRFVCRLAPGDYYYVVTARGRHPFPERGPSAATYFTTYRCTDDATAGYRECGRPAPRDRDLFIQIPDAAELHVDIRDAAGRPLPAKVTLVSTYEPEYDGRDPMDFLFDLWLGERRRPTDLTWRDPPGARERRYVEEVFVTHDGFVAADVRPSCDAGRCRPYDVVVSRGPEYDVHVARGLTFESGRRHTVEARLTRVVDTTDWVAADLHVHSINSVDSSFAVNDRLKQAAAEGLEIPVASDHNWVSDWRPAIAGLGLGDWLNTVAGVELSTLEMGHFNVFPLHYDVGAATRFPFVAECNPARGDKANRTAFDWVECAPQQLFDNARALGRYGASETIVQINHPRDTILGYFNQYFLHPWLAVPDCRGAAADATDPACAYCADHCAERFARNHPETAFFLYPHDRAPGQFGRGSFSWDFDAIEVLNGKRLDMLHGFRVAGDISAERLAEINDVCNGGHPDNAPGELRLENGGHIAFPGGVDDWLHMLNDGRRFAAVGSSDSHELSSEVGVPRTYLYVEPAAGGRPRDGAPGAVSDRDVVRAIRSGRVLVTNGPFLEMLVVTEGRTTWPMGSVVSYGHDHRGQPVEVVFVLKSAPWIAVDEIVVWANARVVARIPVPGGTAADGRAIDDDHTLTWSGSFSRDTVLVAEARGNTSLFPVVTPEEEPPSNITDALGGIVSGLGLAGSFSRGDDIVAPNFVQKVTPYALANPIWLDIDGSGRWDPPGNEAGPGPAPEPEPGECDRDGSRRAVDGRIDIRELFAEGSP